MTAREDAGLVISRSLAWTILTALIAAGVWIGFQVQHLSGVAHEVRRQDGRIAALEMRVTTSERELAVTAARLGEMLRILERVDDRVARMEQRSSNEGERR